MFFALFYYFFICLTFLSFSRRKISARVFLYVRSKLVAAVVLSRCEMFWNFCRQKLFFLLLPPPLSLILFFYTLSLISLSLFSISLSLCLSLSLFLLNLSLYVSLSLSLSLSQFLSFSLFVSLSFSLFLCLFFLSIYPSHLSLSLIRKAKTSHSLWQRSKQLPLLARLFLYRPKDEVTLNWQKKRRERKKGERERKRQKRRVMRKLNCFLSI